LLATFFDALAP